MISGHGGDLCEKFDEVWKIISKELGAYDHVLACVVGLKSRAEKFGLALYPECRPPVRTLYIMIPQYIALVLALNIRTLSHLESVSVQTLRKTRKRLESGASMRDEGDSRDGTRNFSCCELDSLRLTGLVLERAYQLLVSQCSFSITVRCCRPHQTQVRQAPWFDVAMTGKQHAEPAGRWQCA